ncbi:hypothetical protein [Natronoarchaeum philippinense]|uniref:hypothetical protein n=1 Tax=Natronoarchaeum philippinense TaxID=558529 RepID=UPI000BE32CBF|nr:hypothetical protein [Natronoarchaeum philippinense]
MNVAFESLPDPGIEVIDPIERVRYSLFTDVPVEPTEADDSVFRFPIDDAATIECSTITLPTVAPVIVRDEAGEVLASTEHGSHEEIPKGTYSMELSVQLRIYLHVESEVTIASSTERTSIEFGEQTQIVLGGRSKHERPAATLTTTDDPTDVMQAVSAMSSSLKTTSPERSLPTLRGHPPSIELGEELSIPDGVEPPETGVRIELPPTYRHVYPAATLAYYLGAEMVPGETPRIVTDEGLDYDLDGPGGYEREVVRVLKRVFFLDCLTRTEGLYPVELHERDALEQAVELDFESLYDASLQTQLAAYLDVPYDAVEDLLPQWKLTTHVSPTAQSIETLPYLVNDLAVVRIAEPERVSASSVEETGMAAYTRGGAESAHGNTYVQVESDDALEQAWVGEETPIGVSKATAQAYRNRFDREPSTGDISITVVCNDDRMDSERDAVDEVYGSRANLPFEVTVERDLETDELAATLAEPTEFLHYVGHIDAEGFRCADGTLDAGELDEVGVEAFLLNACQSYDQGAKLIDAGAIGGITTLSDVINTGAVRIGSTVARLLNAGFPLRAALTIAKDESIVGSQYLVVGDGGLTIAQSESGTPLLGEITPVGDDEYEFTFAAYATTSGGMGGMFMPFIESNDEFYLNSGRTRSFRITESELAEFLELEDIPIRVSGELSWSGDVSVSDIS